MPTDPHPDGCPLMVFPIQSVRLIANVNQLGEFTNALLIYAKLLALSKEDEDDSDANKRQNPKSARNYAWDGGTRLGEGKD